MYLTSLNNPKNQVSKQGQVHVPFGSFLGQMGGQGCPNEAQGSQNEAKGTHFGPKIHMYLTSLNTPKNQVQTSCDHRRSRERER